MVYQQRMLLLFSKYYCKILFNNCVQLTGPVYKFSTDAVCATRDHGERLLTTNALRDSRSVARKLLATLGEHRNSSLNSSV